MNWKPIETAPKNRRILLFYPKCPFTGCNVQIGKWDDDRYAVKPTPHWDNDQHRIWGRPALKSTSPTHWAEIIRPETEL